MRKLIALSAIILLVVATSTAQASSHRHVPGWFVKGAECVHSYEASKWKWTPSYHPGYTYWNRYWTGLQFLRSTWHRANVILHMWTPPGTGNKHLVILHAYAIYRSDGNSWREWPNTARLCGLPTT